MGFFKDFKDDLSETANEVNETAVDSEENMVEEDVMVNTIDKGNPDLSELSASYAKELEDDTAAGQEEYVDNVDTVSLEPEEEVEDPETVADETAVITSGLVVTGDLDSVGSIDVFGTVVGNVVCRGKLTVSGLITGDSKASEIFADSSRIDGNMEAKGSVKIGQGTVIIGNIKAASAVIAGAVKGDIDVMGPVIVDSTAVIVGDIKSKTVQINNGATIDGRCTQCYAEVNTDAIFDIKKKGKK